MIKLLTTTMVILGVATTAMAAPREIVADYVNTEWNGNITESTTIWVDQGDGTWQNSANPAYSKTTAELLSERATQLYMQENGMTDWRTVEWSEIKEATGVDSLSGQKSEEVELTIETTHTQYGNANYSNPDPNYDGYAYDEGNGWVYGSTGKPLREEHLETLVIRTEYIAPETMNETFYIEATGDYLKYGNDYEPKSNGDLDAAIQLRATLVELAELKAELQQAIADALTVQAAPQMMQMASLSVQWEADPALSRQSVDGLISSQMAVEDDSTRITANTTAIADNKANIESNTQRIEDLEDRVTRLENPTQAKDSKAVKYARKMWVDAKKAKQGTEPVYYTTSKNITIDLRALSTYDPQNGVAVTKEYQEQMGLVSVWVGK